MIFASYNGEATVAQSLEAMCRLAPPARGWQLIAVDNGSSDGTAGILQSFLRRLPLQILTVPTRGKNHALNAALAHVEGDLVVFTDDDVVPHPDWLRALQACAAAHPGHGLFGGAILPRWPSPPDPSILSNLSIGMLYAATPPERAEGEIANDLIWGPNMAVRRSVLDTGIRFHTDIGPDGTARYMMGSETDFAHRLTALGVKGWFCAAARVEHLVRPRQMTREWILDRYFSHGRSSYRFDHAPVVSDQRLWGAERWLYRKLFNAYCKTAWLWLSGRRNPAFKARAESRHIRGQILQSRLMHRSGES